MNQKKRISYPEEIKSSILAKALAPNAPKIKDLAKEFNIPYNTIYSWMTDMLKNKSINKTDTSGPQRPQDKTAKDKLQAVIDTIDKTEAERSAYCRQHGIYVHHLDEWKTQMLDGLGVSNNKKVKAEHQLIMNEVKQLKCDLARKEKALAEISALLILKKKADLLWGDDSEDA